MTPSPSNTDKKKVFEMSPPIFATPQSRFEQGRLNQAIRKQVEIGGKLFCSHDFTYMKSSRPVNNLFDWRFVYCCIKCGKEKTFKNMQIEPVPLIN